ncbi:MAG: IMP dehydrogenase [Candidatus Latescibacteria bacterium]|nr:IMP dehydrogenase [Candidatus Latescibacterota bacterium]
MKIKQAFAFDDILLVPQKSSVLPKDVDTQTFFTRHIRLHIPLVSAAMDTVSESKMAISLAKCGGIGVIHKNLSIEKQALEVTRVKRAESGMIVNPVTINPEQTLNDAKNLMEKYLISGLPVTDDSGRLVGILTKRDIIFETNLTKRVKYLMTKNNLVTAPVGTSLNQAQEILKKHKIEKLPIIDKRGQIKGLITIKDIIKKHEFTHSTTDKLGRLRVAAAIGTSKEYLDRASVLIKSGVDALVIDTAHGQSLGVVNTAKTIRKKFPDVDLVVGNVATGEAVKDLLKLDIDAIKVGIGPGSICTTRVIAGIGVPQFTAINNCALIAKQRQIPIIADGGIRFSGDIVKAIAAGASSVMIGNLFAGTEESPGEEVLLEGRKYKIYRAMGSIDAMKQGSADRYFQEHAKKYVPEGIEGRVPYRGKVSDVIYQLIGGLKAGMGYCGTKNIKELQTKAKFVCLSNAGLKESHPHDITITKEAPNYEKTNN